MLFPDSRDRDAVLSLLASNVSDNSLFTIMGKRLLDSDELVWEDPAAQLLSIVSLAPFTSSIDECKSIVDIVLWGATRPDILPELITHKGGKNLAYRCLLSLSFYKKYMEVRTERRGAPSPKFYRQIGVSTFYNMGMEDIGNHFENWETFLPEVLLAN